MIWLKTLLMLWQFVLMIFRPWLPAQGVQGIYESTFHSSCSFIQFLVSEHLLFNFFSFSSNDSISLQFHGILTVSLSDCKVKLFP
jgi:hypothetical protein